MVMSNPTRWLKPGCLSALMSVGVLLGASRASAQTCGDNDACPRGFTCHSYESVTCAKPDCPPDAKDCVVPECKPQLIKECMPSACTADSDCADGMVCFTEEFTTCSGGTAAAAPRCDGDAGDCKQLPAPEPTPDACTSMKRSSCVPRYVPPCHQDTDCGPGFHCKEVEETSCSSSGAKSDVGTGGKGGSEAAMPLPADAGTPPSDDPTPPAGDDFAAIDAGVPPIEPGDKPVPETTCTTKPTGRFYCELQMVNCKQNSDCPSGFTCEGYGKTDVACAAPPPAAERPLPVDAGVPMNGGEGGGDSSSADAGINSGAGAAPDAGKDGDAFAPSPAPPPPLCEQPQVQMFCIPPYANAGFGFGLPGRDADLAAQGGTSKGESGVPVPTAADGGSSNGIESPKAPEDDTSTPKPVLNCSAGHLGGTRSSTLGLIALAGVAMYLQRRRARS